MESTLLLVDNFDQCATRLDDVYAESKVIDIELQKKTGQIVELLKCACVDYKLTWETVFPYDEQRDSDLQSEITIYSIDSVINALKNLRYKYERKFHQCDHLKRNALNKRKIEINEVMCSKMKYKKFRIGALKHKYSTRCHSLRMYHVNKYITSLQKLFSEVNALQSEIKNHPFKRVCKQEFDTFLDTVKVAMSDIRKTSTYRGNCYSRSQIDKLVTEGKLTKKHKPVTTSEKEAVIMSKSLSTFMSKWRSDDKVSMQDIDTILTSFDTSYKFSVLYSMITYPFSQNNTFEMYKYVCGKFFELLDQHPYLVDYDAILNHPIVCELTHQTHYHFFSPSLRDHADVVKLRNHFIRELISRRSELLLHIDEYGTTVLENLVK